MRETDGKEIVRQFNIEYITGEIEARRSKKQLCRQWRLIFGSRWLPFFLYRNFARRWLSPKGLFNYYPMPGTGVALAN
jgi:hypothetical protein